MQSRLRCTLIALCSIVPLTGIGCGDNGLQPDPPSPPPGPQAGIVRQLPIAPVFQATTQWCWATRAEMVFRFYGLPSVNPVGHYQCGIIGVAGAIGVLPPICNLDCLQCVVPISTAAGYTAILQGYPGAVRSLGLPARNIAVENRGGSMTWQAVVASIDGNVPVITGINPSGIPNSYGPEHAALIVGYDTTVSGTQSLIVNDPFPYGLGPLGPFGDPYILTGGRLVRPGQYAIAYAAFAQRLVWNYTLIPR
jgi:hypothetical protein